MAHPPSPIPIAVSDLMHRRHRHSQKQLGTHSQVCGYPKSHCQYQHNSVETITLDALHRPTPPQRLTSPVNKKFPRFSEHAGGLLRNRGERPRSGVHRTQSTPKIELGLLLIKRSFTDS
jgi:hypothetical protein